MLSTESCESECPQAAHTNQAEEFPALRTWFSKEKLELVHFEFGYVLVGIDSIEGLAPGHAYIADIWVDPEHRGRGEGKLMVAAIADAAFGLGLTKILGSANNSDAEQRGRLIDSMRGLGWKLLAGNQESVIFYGDLK